MSAPTTGSSTGGTGFGSQLSEQALENVLHKLQDLMAYPNRDYEPPSLNYQGMTFHELQHDLELVREEKVLWDRLILRACVLANEATAKISALSSELTLHGIIQKGEALQRNVEDLQKRNEAAVEMLSCLKKEKEAAREEPRGGSPFLLSAEDALALRDAIFCEENATGSDKKGHGGGQEGHNDLEEDAETAVASSLEN